MTLNLVWYLKKNILRWKKKNTNSFCSQYSNIFKIKISHHKLKFKCKNNMNYRWLSRIRGSVVHCLLACPPLESFTILKENFRRVQLTTRPRRIRNRCPWKALAGLHANIFYQKIHGRGYVVWTYLIGVYIGVCFENTSHAQGS